MIKQLQATQRLKAKLNRALASSDLAEIALMMGYNRRTAIKAGERLKALLASDDLGLDKGYDLKYTSKQFLQQICSLLMIPPNEFDAAIAEIMEYKDKLEKAFRGWIFVDTNFKLKNEPIFILGLIENKRRIRPEPEFNLLPVHEQIEKVQKMVRQHYKENDGEVFIWGKIQRYLFHYSENDVLAISPDGQLLETAASFPISQASISIKRTPLDSVIKLAEPNPE